MSGVDGGCLLLSRHRLIVAAAALVVAAVLAVAAGPSFLKVWNGRGEHPCVPLAAVMLDYFPRGLAPARWDELERDPPLSSRDDCVTDQSSYSIKPGDGSPLGLAFGYERFEATSEDSGADVASQRLAEQRPSDATDLDFSDRIYGEEGYLAAALVEDYASVELLLRDRNVLLTVTYRVDRPLSQATRHAEHVGDRMLEELNDYLSN